MKPRNGRRENPDANVAFAAIRDAAVAWKARADAGLGSREQAELETWLAADGRHREAFARFGEVWERFDRPFNAGATDHLIEELQRRSRRRRRRTISAAAGLAVLLAIGALWRSPVGAGPGSPVAATGGSPLAPSAVLHLPVRQDLPDGSVVELREGARMAIEFTPEWRRVVLLSGEAHFQVAPNAARPFVVVAGRVEARAVGTAFSVQIRPEAVEVLVTEGQVAVEQAVTLPAAAGGPGGLPLAPPEPLAVLGIGHSVVVDRASSSLPQVTMIRPEELDERLAWRAPRVEFTRTSLAEAVALLNRHAAERSRSGQRSVRFILEDPALAEMPVSGLFRVDRTDAFLGLLRHGFGVEAESRGDGEVLLRRAAAEPPP